MQIHGQAVRFDAVWCRACNESGMRMRSLLLLLALSTPMLSIMPSVGAAAATVAFSQERPLVSPPPEPPLKPTDRSLTGGANRFFNSTAFEVLVLLGALWWIASRFSRRRREESLLQASYYEDPPESGSALRIVSYPSEDEALQLRQYRNLWIEQFMNIQTAWNGGDLKEVVPILSPDLMRELDGELRRLRSEGRRNHTESIMIRLAEPVDSWKENGREYATVHFRGTMLDYNTDAASGAPVNGEGDSQSPAEFDEFWTFVRSYDSQGVTSPWTAHAVKRSDHGRSLPRLASLY
jgi:hypothetical protein